MEFINILINIVRKISSSINNWTAKNQALKQIRQGSGIFTTWNYTPADWAILVDEFPKLKPANAGGKVSFTDHHIYLTNNQKEILHEVVREMKTEGEGKHLTEVRHLKISPDEFVTFRVRTKKIARDSEGKDTYEEKCDVDNLKIAVPRQHRAEAGKVINFYQQIIDKNAAAVANVMPRSSGLGLFGG
jgi:hypothetical protein